MEEIFEKIIWCLNESNGFKNRFSFSKVHFDFSEDMPNESQVKYSLFRKIKIKNPIVHLRMIWESWICLKLKRAVDFFSHQSSLQEIYTVHFDFNL